MSGGDGWKQLGSCSQSKVGVIEFIGAFLFEGGSGWEGCQDSDSDVVRAAEPDCWVNGRWTVVLKSEEVYESRVLGRLGCRDRPRRKLCSIGLTLSYVQFGHNCQCQAKLCLLADGKGRGVGGGQCGMG